MKDFRSYQKSCSIVSGATWESGKIYQKRSYVNTYSEVVKVFMSNTTKDLDAALVGDDLMLLQYQLIDDAACTAEVQHQFGILHHSHCSCYTLQLSVKNQKPLIYYTATATASCTFTTPTICRKLQIFQRGPILGS